MQFKHKSHHIAGCGTRKLAIKKTVYLVTNGPEASTLEGAIGLMGDMIKDPPIWIQDPSALGIAPQGISVVELGGIYHAFDWIGVSEPGYPNPADILTEVLLKDGSTLVPITKELELLEPGQSQRLLVHPHGLVFNAAGLKKGRHEIPGIPNCFLPEGDMRDYHLGNNDQYCAGLHWQNVEKAKKIDGRSREATKRIGDIEYGCMLPPDNFKPEYGVAVIAAIPIDEIHLVVGNMAENPPEINDLIQESIDLIGGMNISLPIFLTDN